jgi:DNA-binding response OmpR family regulator/outer membrane protein OmpA-like peptidoglycan-associated protein
MRMLIAEDDPALAGFVKKGLEAEHYAVDVSADGERARALASEINYDLMVLDLNLPRLDGVSILRQVRTRKPSMPILVLTGRNRVEDRVQCLDLGADDYLVKPFSFTELSARIRALLRRSHLPAESVLAVEDLKLDRVERRVERSGRRIELTSKEFTLLEYLMRNAGRRITRAMIIEHVWNLSLDTSTNVVDVYINYSTAQIDKKKVGQLAAAIQTAFQQMGAFPPPVGQARPDASLILNPPVPPKSTPLSTEENGDLASLRKELQQLLAQEIAKGEVAVREGPDGLVISLREIGFFDSGSAGVKAGAQVAVSRIAALLAQHPYQIRIEGHTDNIPIHTAQFPSNWELSTARSTELVRLLIMNYGFAPERLSAAGYAEYHPIAGNDTPRGQAQNRRVDIVILREQPAGDNPQQTPGPPAKPSPSTPE